MMCASETSPRVYVGTYAKYNDGNLAGAWVDLDDYTDRESFYAAARALHADESDPELMFQDFENFPRALYSESEVSEALIEFARLDDDDRELLAVYTEYVDSAGDIDTARERFAGRYDTKAAWAEEYIEETGMLDSVPDDLARYFDYESWARDQEFGGDIAFVRHSGDVWVFRTN